MSHFQKNQYHFSSIVLRHGLLERRKLYENQEKVKDQTKDLFNQQREIEL